jgi:hypothetical protein
VVESHVPSSDFTSAGRGVAEPHKLLMGTNRVACIVCPPPRRVNAG